MSPPLCSTGSQRAGAHTNKPVQLAVEILPLIIRGDSTTSLQVPIMPPYRASACGVAANVRAWDLAAASRDRL